MSEILNKISDYKNKILDHILLELYKKDSDSPQTHLIFLVY